jgi:hypothetical protein
MSKNNKYEARVNLQVSFGKYKWCGNMSSASGSGYTLTNNQTYYYKDGKESNFMLHIDIYMNDELLVDVEYIEILTESNFLFHYSQNKLTNHYSYCTKMDEKYIGQEFKITFVKPKPLNEEEYQKLMKSFRRHPMIKVYETTVEIPEMKLFEKNTCSICIEDVVDDNNKHITKCGHLFHNNCFWNYLLSIPNLISEVHKNCSSTNTSGHLLCCNVGKIVNTYCCPVCKNELLK